MPRDWMLLVCMCAFVASQARAQGEDDCSPDALTRREPSLPPFIEIRTGESTHEALMRELGCTGFSGHSAGASDGIQATASTEASVATPSMGEADSAASAATVAGDAAQATASGEMSAGATGSMGAPESGASAAVAVGSTASGTETQSTGLVTLQRIKVSITSVPEGAKIFFENTSYGVTAITGAVRQAALKTLRLEMDGFQPCDFENGTYNAPGDSGSNYATFKCVLSAN
jgi:hypothetical protein